MGSFLFCGGSNSNGTDLRCCGKPPPPEAVPEEWAPKPEDPYETPKNLYLPEGLAGRFAILNLLSQPLDTRIFFPTEYLAAVHETFGLTLIITWLLTAVGYRDQITDHPAKPIIGSYNPCFGWDYAPAANIGMMLCAFNVYFGWRYAWLRMTRSRLLNEPTTPGSILNWAASICYPLSCNLWLNLWLIGPTADPIGDDDGPVIRAWFVHTAIFFAYAVSGYLCVLGNLLEIACGPRSRVIKPKHIIFTSVYGLSVSYLVFVYSYSLWNYEHGEPPALGSGIFTQAADIIWMACLNLLKGFMPPELPLRMSTEVVLPRRRAAP